VSDFWLARYEAALVELNAADLRAQVAEAHAIAAEQRAEEAEGLLRDAAKALDALCLATGQRRDMAARIETFLAAPKEKP